MAKSITELLTEANEYAETLRTYNVKTEAVKHDAGKPPLSLLPADALVEIAKVMDFGAKKYSPDNWRSNGGFHWRRLVDAALRHLMAFNAGEDTDSETGLSHVAHLGCCVLFLLEHQIKDLGVDDRFKYPTDEGTLKDEKT